MNGEPAGALPGLTDGSTLIDPVRALVVDRNGYVPAAVNVKL